MKIVVLGLTITSAWGNGHATTYRSLLRALARRGHVIEFIEKDLEWYRNNRDLPHPNFCKVLLYEDWAQDSPSLLRRCSEADAIVVGSYFPDAIQASEQLFAAGFGPLLFYDIDTPITIGHLLKDGICPYLASWLIPHYDAYLSFTGGPLLQQLEEYFRARYAVPLYCSVDPDLHHPVPPREIYRSALSYLGTYARDRQEKLMELLNAPAEHLPDSSFVVAGAMYPPETPWAPNVRALTHVSPPDHPAFYCSSRFTLNLTRSDMIAVGYSPSVRLFEASACGAAILSDSWAGLDEFLRPGEELLVPSSTDDVVDILKHCSDEERCRIGSRARARILAEHTAEHRAQEFEGIVSQCASRPITPRSATPQTIERKGPELRSITHQ